MSEPLTDADRLAKLLHGRHAAVLILTSEEDYADRTVRDAAKRVKRKLCTWSAVGGARDPSTINLDGASLKDSEHPAAALYHFARAIDSEKLCVLYDLIGHLHDARTLRAWRELVRRAGEVGGTVILIDHADDVPAIVRAECTRLELSLPEELEIERLLRAALRRLHVEHELDIKLTKSQFSVMVRNLLGLSRRQCEQIITDAVAIDRVIDESDIAEVVARKRQLLHQDGLLDYVQAPVSLDEVGGLVHLKAWLKKRANAFKDEAREFGLTPPRGVLMLGVQGAGKSLCAKAIATAWKRPLLRLDPGSLYDRYVGESERRLRQALKQAEMMSPIVLWIDEIEKGFASAASHSNDGGLSQRMFGALLTWMQEHTRPVFLVATANDIDALPPELLRKGRFDEIFFVDLPDEETRKKIFEIHLTKRKRNPKEFDLAALSRASEGYSGAEIEQAVISGLHESFSTGDPLKTESIVAALRHSPPLSVTMRERIEDLREWAKGRCVPAG